jgi:hypothetical protein
MTKQLPPPLMPWAALLEIFPTDLARALGPLVQRLDVAIGPLRARHRAGQGEPDGYNGLERRGLYERLLISEWLLAEELPDEFARRAATGEHAFLKSARREPAQARSCVALLDAGPSQLGAPRLAHLAALIVLARRAQLAGARFEWGILQDEAQTLFDEISPHNIELWLQARTTKILDNENLIQWRDHVSAASQGDDFWMIGGRDLESYKAAQGTSLLLVEDPLDCEARTLQVQVKMAQRTAQNIILELPAGAACARLLREPFGMAQREWRKVSQACAAQSNLFFADSSRLLARGAEGVVLYQIPKTPSGGMPRPKRYQVDVKNLVAAGVYGRAVMAVVQVKDGFQLLCLNKRSSPFDYGPYEWTGLSLRNSSPDFTSQLASLFFVEGEKVAPLMWLPQAKDQCLLRFDIGHKQTLVVAFLVMRASQLFGPNLLYAVSSESACQIIHFQTPDKFEVIRLIDNVSQVFFYAEAGQSQYISIGIQKSNGRWQILNQEKQFDLTPPAETQVFGVMHISHKWQAPGLICLSSDKRSVAIWGCLEKRVEWHHVLRANEDIQQITVCPTAPRIAYATEHEMAVYCLETQMFLLRVRWEDV